jgi:hypothetical protein
MMIVAVRKIAKVGVSVANVPHESLAALLGKIPRQR